jgi:hypothetical protein
MNSNQASTPQCLHQACPHQLKHSCHWGRECKLFLLHRKQATHHPVNFQARKRAEGVAEAHTNAWLGRTVLQEPLIDSSPDTASHQDLNPQRLQQ